MHDHDGGRPREEPAAVVSQPDAAVRSGPPQKSPMPFGVPKPVGTVVPGLRPCTGTSGRSSRSCRWSRRTACPGSCTRGSRTARCARQRVHRGDDGRGQRSSRRPRASRRSGTSRRPPRRWPGGDRRRRRCTSGWRIPCRSATRASAANVAASAARAGPRGLGPSATARVPRQRACRRPRSRTGTRPGSSEVVVAPVAGGGGDGHARVVVVVSSSFTSRSSSGCRRSC